MNIIKMVILRGLTIICASLLLISFASAEINKEHYDKIKDDMTMQQVISILGQPTQMAEFNMLDKKHVIATWKDDGNVIVVQFVNGKVDLRHMTNNKPTSPVTPTSPAT